VRDWLLAFAALLVLTDVFDAALYAAFGNRAELLPHAPISRLLLLAVFAAAAILLAADSRRAVEHARAAWFLWPPIGLALASAAWSDQPGRTMLWSVGLFGTSALGLALATRFSARAQAVLVSATVGSVALASALAIVLWPGIGIHRRGDWRGVFVQKNLLGRVLALGTAAAGVVALSARQCALALVTLLLYAAVLWGTHSLASLFAAVTTLAAALLLLVARARRRHAVAILAGGAAATVLIVVLLITTRPGLTFVGRNETLSSRTTIWREVLSAGMQTPWLGHGYGAFWTSPSGQRALAGIHMKMPINHAHNGFLDLFAELGLTGLVLVAAPLAIVAAGAFRHALEAGAPACLWPAAYVVFFAASNVAESALLRHKIYWALYVAVACHVARQGNQFHRVSTASDGDHGGRVPTGAR
jgi:O-antigen ligase